MLDFTNLDATQFFQDAVNNVRVYYQNDDKTIRESCFNDQQKWFTRGDIVTRQAKANTPIAVTRWNNGTEVTSSRMVFCTEFMRRLTTEFRFVCTTSTSTTRFARYVLSV
jgi:hypothetical protein